MKKYLLPLIMIGSLLSVPQAYADDVWNMAESEEYGKKSWGMLGRGLINAASCFVDLAVQTVEKTQDGPPLVGTLTGIGSGAGCTILRAGSGVLDVASFWVPGFNGIPVSRSYSNCMDVDQTGPYSTAPARQSYAAPQKSYSSSNNKPTVISGTNTIVSKGAPGNEGGVQKKASAAKSTAKTTVKSAPKTASSSASAPVKKHDPMKYVKK